jgi:hypothetical protein
MSYMPPAAADRQLPRSHLLVLNRSFQRTLEAENKNSRTMQADAFGDLPGNPRSSAGRRATGDAPHQLRGAASAAVVDVGRPGGSAPGSTDRSHPVIRTANTASRASHPARRATPPVMRAMIATDLARSVPGVGRGEGGGERRSSV